MKRLLQWLWGFWERYFARTRGIVPVGQGEEGMLRIGLVVHRGAPVILEDGTRIEPGDLLGELHLGNERIEVLRRQGLEGNALYFTILRELKSTMAALQRLVAEGKLDPRIKAFYAVSLFHRGARMLGFEVRPVRSFWVRWSSALYEKWLLILYHPAGWRRLGKGSQRLEAREVWLSRRRLLEGWKRDEKDQEGGPTAKL